MRRAALLAALAALVTAGFVVPGVVAGHAERRPFAILRNLPYASSSPAQTVDLWLPGVPADHRRPVVILIHGGAFEHGYAAKEDAHARALVDAGFAVASVNYRLSQEATFPAAAQDVKSVVRWVRAHADTYDLDPDRVGAWGESAGGWLSSMLGVTGDQSTIFDSPNLGNTDHSDQVQAVASWFGLSDFTTIQQQADASGCQRGRTHDGPLSFESRWLGETVMLSPQAPATSLERYAATANSLPPFFITAGDADCVVPDEQSQQLASALHSHGDRSVTLRIVPGLVHGDPRFDTTELAPTIAFFKQTLAG